MSWKLFLSFVVATAVLLQPFTSAFALSKDDVLVFTNDRIPFDPDLLNLPSEVQHNNAFSRLQLTLQPDGKPDPKNIMFQAMRYLSQNQTANQTVDVNYVYGFRTFSGKFTMSHDIAMKLAKLLLDNTIKHRKVVEKSAFAYVSYFLPLSAVKIAGIDGEVAKSGIAEILASQPKSKGRLRRLEHSVGEMKKLALTISMFGRLEKSGALTDKDKETFIEDADSSFASMARAVNEVSSSRLGTDKTGKMADGGVDYRDRVQKLVKSVLFDDMPEQTKEIAIGVLKRRLAEARLGSEVGFLNGMTNVTATGAGITSLIYWLSGGLSLHNPHTTAAHILEWTAFYTVSERMVAGKNRRLNDQEARLIDAILTGDKAAACEVRAELVGNL